MTDRELPCQELLELVTDCLDDALGRADNLKGMLVEAALDEDAAEADVKALHEGACAPSGRCACGRDPALVGAGLLSVLIFPLGGPLVVRRADTAPSAALEPAL
jgi:hypothetical protein